MKTKRIYGLLTLLLLCTILLNPIKVFAVTPTPTPTPELQGEYFGISVNLNKNTHKNQSTGNISDWDAPGSYSITSNSNNNDSVTEYQDKTNSARTTIIYICIILAVILLVINITRFIMSANNPQKRQ